MIKDLAEDLILIALIALAGWLAWRKYFAAGVAATVKEYKANINTITGAITPDAGGSVPSFLSDLWKSTTPYISQDQFKQNIAEIQAQLKGKAK